MMTYQHSSSIRILGPQKHDKAQADKIGCMTFNMNCPEKNIIMVTTITKNK